MASLLHFLFFFFISFLLNFSPVISLKCSSQIFSNNTHFANCTDLTFLKSSLHWTYNSKNSTLSIAFIAPLPSNNGWIAWGINPTTPSMIGTHSLIAFKESNGSIVVKTYNLTSYKTIVESNKLLFTVLDSKAESSNGVMKILATLVLPANLTSVNHVWQIGPVVKDGIPVVHKFDADNLNSKGILDLATSSGDRKKNAIAPTHAPAPANNIGGQNRKETSGSSKICESDFSFYVFLLFLGVWLL
ncbi:auxin-induced in root cultures protein 12-like [Nicotiana tabacum]|uniref:Auxin-induced in root cultures protein 12-like n=1 Tax=Nicotiana tabacum TaxID=4097 RepID=A0A1S4DR19_TOBAC|nr:PREDICTED: auxin-induced in root cultures protein 12-like [Nicotiana tabacum]